MQVIPASCRASTPPVMTMRRCALSEAPPGPHGETAVSKITPTTSVAAPNPSTVPIPVRSSSVIPRPGVTETSLLVKVASSLPSSAGPAAVRPAVRADGGACVADAGRELASRTAAIAAAPSSPAPGDAVVLGDRFHGGLLGGVCPEPSGGPDRRGLRVTQWRYVLDVGTGDRPIG